MAHGAGNHKDRLFSDIFSHKECALSLFHAVNGTDHTDEDAIRSSRWNRSYTLRNDLAVCFHASLQLFDQQSTRNPNMPLREFLYSAEEYDKWLIDHEKDVLGRISGKTGRTNHNSDSERESYFVGKGYGDLLWQ